MTSPMRNSKSSFENTNDVDLRVCDDLTGSRIGDKLRGRIARDATRRVVQLEPIAIPVLRVPVERHSTGRSGHSLTAAACIVELAFVVALNAVIVVGSISIYPILEGRVANRVVIFHYRDGGLCDNGRSGCDSCGRGSRGLSDGRCCDHD